MRKVRKMVMAVGGTLFSTIILAGMTTSVRAESSSQANTGTQSQPISQVIDDKQTQVSDEPGEGMKRIAVVFSDISYPGDNRPMDVENKGKFCDSITQYIDINKDISSMTLSELIEKYPIPKGYSLTDTEGNAINGDIVSISSLGDIGFFEGQDEEIFKVNVLPIQRLNENIVINNVRMPYVVNKRFDLDKTSLAFEYPSGDIVPNNYELDESSTLGIDVKTVDFEYHEYSLNDDTWKKELGLDFSLLSSNLEKINKINEYFDSASSGFDFSVIYRGVDFTYNLVYKTKSSDTGNLIVEFKTADGNIVNNPVPRDAPENIKDYSEYGNEIPDNYQLTDSTPTCEIDDNTLILSFIVEPIKPEEPEKPSTGGSGSTSSSKPTNPSVDISENISVHPTISQTKFYDNNGNALDKDLPNKSDYHADKRKTINGTTYYRIATNTWVKGADVYIYHDQPTYVRTYLDSYKFLANSQNKKITNRALQAGSDWYSDRYAYFNDEKYYRVSTNEWVKADDAFEYDPINKIVTTTGNQVFDETGNVVRSLDAGIVLRTDKIATINGVKMYRVATNEWIN